MLISKTIFKEYTRCPRVCALDDIYIKKTQTNTSIFSDDYETFYDILGSMFDLETGENNIDIVNPQLEALLPYYNSFEEYAMKIAKSKFGENITYSLKTKEQKSFQFNENSYKYITYLDGYQENNDVVRVFEVKATTSRKFLDLGTSINKEKISIFERNDNILKVKSNVDMPVDKFNENYNKLFDRYSDVGKYVLDLSVERYIIERSLEFKKLNNRKFEYYLVVLNKDYEYNGKIIEGKPAYDTDINGNELVLFIDLTEETFKYQKNIERMNNDLIKSINSLDARVYPIGRYCERKAQGKCAFTNVCWEKADSKGSLFEYLQNYLGFSDGVNKYKTTELFNEGYETIDSIPIEWLERKNNQIQRHCFDNNIEYINYQKIKAGLNTLVYPLYYLDFESFPSPLPRFNKEHPYNQSVFQFSLHRENSIKSCDIDKDHYHYLPIDTDDHREELIQKMIEYIDLENGGTVIVYNKAFEHTRIKELIEIFPKYKKELQNINDHMFDLLDIINTRSEFYKDLGFSIQESKEINFYNNNLHGSYSIKKVLPVFSNLSYEELNVKNGTQAIAAYASFDKLELEDRQEVYDSLVKYCKQDTWAMVVILWGLYDKIKK